MKEKFKELGTYLKKNSLRMFVYSTIIFITIVAIIEKINLDEIEEFMESRHPEITAIVICVVLLLFRIFKKAGSHFRSAKLNSIDFVFYTIDLVLLLLLWKYKVVKCCCLIRAYIMLHLIRCMFFLLNSKTEKYNTVYLSDVYNNYIKEKKYDSIFIKGDESEIDLLNKKNEITAIKDAILNCNPEKSFFIGIDGEWGKGKTTLIKLVKKELEKEENNIVIVEFDPCGYKDCESMIAGFYNEIAKKIGIFDSIKYKTQLKELVCDISGNISKKVNVSKYSARIFEESDVNSIICAELETCDEKMLIIIDNLDRADKEITNFFIRCMYSVTEFNRTIFLILHDANLLNQQLSKTYNTNKLFMSKIINLPISIADTDKQKINEIWNTSQKHLMAGKYMEEDYIEEVDFYEDLREVIRSLNCLIYKSNTLKKLKLNYYDYFGLIHIKEHDYVLYNKIHENYEILTYKPKNNYYIKAQEEEEKSIQTRIKNLYDEINDIGCKEIVKKMFRNVRNVIELHGLFPENDDDYESNEKKNSIDQPYYFYMYFLIEESEYAMCENKMNKIINKINKQNKKQTFIAEIQKHIIKEENETLRAYCIEILRKYLKTRNDYDPLIYFEGIRDLLSNYSNDRYVIDNFEDLVIIPLRKMDENKFNMEIDNIKDDYKNLWIYSQIAENYMEIEKSDKIKDVVQDMCNFIVNNKDNLNLLNNENWEYNNIPVLFKHLGRDRASELMLNWANEDTIINYIKAGIATSYEGKTYRYKYHPVNDKEDNKIKELVINYDTSGDNNLENIKAIYLNSIDKESEEFKVSKETKDGKQIIF